MAGIKNNQLDPSEPRIFDQLTSDPTTGAGKGSYYVKEVSGVAELFYKDSNNNVIQITNNGALNAGGGGASSLPDLSDVTLTSPANTEVLTYNGSQWVNAPAPSGGGSVVDDAYNATTWNGDTTQAASRNALRDKFESLVEADGSIGTHSDVNLTGISNNDFLQWNGSAFVPVALAGGGDLLSTNNLSDVANAATALSNLGGLSSTHAASVGNHTDVSLSGIADGQILKWVNANSRFEPANESGGGGGGVAIEDEGSSVEASASTLDFQGVSHEAVLESANNVIIHSREYTFSLPAAATLADRIAAATGVPAGFTLQTAAVAGEANFDDSADTLVVTHGLSNRVAVEFKCFEITDSGPTNAQEIEEITAIMATQSAVKTNVAKTKAAIMQLTNTYATDTSKNLIMYLKLISA